MARMVSQNMTPGQPVKPAYLSETAGAEWDRILAELSASGIQVSTAHRSLIEQAATIAADLQDASETVEIEGAYLKNEKTGVTQEHPAARRLDTLRRDLIKVLSLIGLRAAVQGSTSEQTLADALED